MATCNSSSLYGAYAQQWNGLHSAIGAIGGGLASSSGTILSSAVSNPHWTKYVAVRSEPLPMAQWFDEPKPSPQGKRFLDSLRSEIKNWCGDALKL